MKKILFIIFALFFIFPVDFFAEDVTTGNQGVETSVINNVDNGSVTTHIQTTVNGKTTVIDSNEPGKIEVKNINGDVEITKILQESPIVRPTHMASVSSTTHPITVKNNNIIANFFEKLSVFLNKLFENL